MAFRSRLEEKVADLLVDLDVKYEYETVKVDYTIAHIYKPDFILPNGVVLECKGIGTAKTGARSKLSRNKTLTLTFAWSSKLLTTQYLKNLKLHTPNTVSD